MKIVRLNFEYKLALAMLASTLAACATGPMVQDFPATASATDEIARMETELSSGQEEQLDVLAPASFREAKSALHDAKSEKENGRSDQEILHDVARARAYFNQAQKSSKISHSNIEDVIVARKLARDSGAPKYFADDYAKADKNLTDVTSEIEKNNLKDAAEVRTRLQAAYLDLELRSIKQTRLGGSRQLVSQAIGEGAKNFAPRSLAIAEKSILDTDAFINANRHNNALLDQRAAATRIQAEHLLKITRSSKSGKKTSSEDMALQLESEQDKVVAKQGQLEDKQDQLSAKQGQLDDKQAEVRQGKADLSAMTAENVNLESEKALNLRFEEARSKFSASEAEVYKQGNTLMIRLRGLEFPVSQALLKGSNFPLLAKVQEVIRSFGTSTVVIEGHTDSNGGKVLNDQLSSDRALAVKEYFVSNAAGQKIEIQAIGYGYQKPIATNKTAAGRAQNRRVDVLIQPAQ